jgi:hypothetical protein
MLSDWTAPVTACRRRTRSGILWPGAVLAISKFCWNLLYPAVVNEVGLSVVEQHSRSRQGKREERNGSNMTTHFQEFGEYNPQKRAVCRNFSEELIASES